ncbi:Origin recognition complex subunit 1 [Entamoeba marina]
MSAITLDQIEKVLVSIKKSAIDLHPDLIIGREKQRSVIEDNITSFAQDHCCRCLLVSGTPGTGKTLLITHLLKKHSGIINPYFFNAVEIGNLKEMLASIAPPTKTKTIFQSLLSKSKRVSQKIVLVIDEFDVLMTEPAHLYKFFDYMFDKSPEIMVILISNNAQFPREIHSRIESRIVCLRINFEFYGLEQIKQIVLTELGKDIIHNIFGQKGFDDFINERIGGGFEYGDVRKVLGMIYNILIRVKQHMEEGSEEVLNNNQISEIINRDSSVPTIEQCSQMEIFTLYCISKCKKSESDLNNIMSQFENIASYKSDLMQWNEGIIRMCIQKVNSKTYSFY